MLIKKSHILFISILAILSGGSCFASPPEDIRVEIRASIDTPTIGDSLTVSLSVTAPETIETGEPFIEGASPFQEYVRYHDETQSPESGEKKRELFYLTYALSPDSLVIGPFRVPWVAADGDSGSVASNVLRLPVTGVMEGEEPKPNRAPMNLPTGIPLWAIAMAAVVLAGLAAWLLLRRRKTEPPVIAPEPPRPIDELEEFEKIRALRLHEQGKIRELYISVSDAVRGFIHRTMPFDALYETSEEIAANLRRHESDETIVRAFGEIMSEADMVKFAKYLPPADRSATVIDRAVEPVKTLLDRIAREKARSAAASESTSENTPKERQPVTADEREGGA